MAMSNPHPSWPDAARVTIDDVRAAGLCAPGARAWLRGQGVDWMAFLRDGMRPERLEAIGDAQALRAVAAARSRLGLD